MSGLKSHYRGHPDQRWGCVTYAQHGDDLMALNLFNLLGVKKPSYLDLGAHHPTTISNTRLLYERGSRGVNVDANPDLIKLFEAERPLDRNVCIGISVKVGFEPFQMFSPTSGRNTFSVDEAARVTRDEGRQVVLSPTFPVTTINELVRRECHGTFPDFLTTDIEGLDYDVLASADFKTYGYPLVICVETRRDETQRMVAMLDERGYFQYCRMGENCFFAQHRYRDRFY